VNHDENPPVALSIAGSDSGAGAGIQADLKTMSALGVFATTAITAVTAQNTARVTEVHHLPESLVAAQVRAVVDDLPVAATKTGLLGTMAVVETVADLAASGLLPQLVVDPVMVASTGTALVAESCVEAYRTRLFPHALLITPNLWEAALLVDEPASEVRGVEAMIELAQRIHRLGPAWVLVKGGHLPEVGRNSDQDAPPDDFDEQTGAVDVLFDGHRATVLSGPRVDTANTHGTGCSLSAAIAAHLARGANVPTAVAAAKAFVREALVGSARWQLGEGHGPLDHLGWTIHPVTPAAADALPRT
jgi:hydroxymethylpyrimidine/phosphomethylpyrimidine kinase